MYIEAIRREKDFSIISQNDGKLAFFDKNGKLLSSYPKELFTMRCPLKSPLVVHLELTRRCGLYCKHCYISAGKPRKNELSTDEWKKVLDQLKELEVLSVYFTGGDPLLHEGCIELLSYARDIGLSCNLLTSGIELENNIDIDKIPKEVFIVLSFDGIKGTYILRNISGKRILGIINNLKTKNRAFAIQSLIFRDNISEIGMTTKWCEESEIEISFNDILPIGRAKYNANLLLEEKQIPELLELEYNIKKYQKVLITSKIPYPVANPNIYQSIANLVKATKRPEPGLFVTYISSDGFLYADNYYAAEGWRSKYNVRNTKISDAWINAFIKERNLKIDSFDGCINCGVFTSNGYCDFQNMAMSKSLYADSNYCGLYPVLKELKIARASLR